MAQRNMALALGCNMDRRTIRHGLPSLHQDCADMARALHSRLGLSALRLGLYVRIKSGLYTDTRNLARETRMFAALLRGVFPHSPFLAMSLLYEPDLGLHKDAQNDWLPSLIIELQSGVSGGTWIQDDEGQTAVESDRGSFLWGTIMTGCYKLSSRSTLHCSVPGESPRLVLVAWTPAGWDTIQAPLKAELCQLGFVWPTAAESRRAMMSRWSSKMLVQQSLPCILTDRQTEHRDEHRADPHHARTGWSHRTLQGRSGVCIDLMEGCHPSPTEAALHRG